MSAFGGTGIGIFPLGPKTGPSVRPTSGIKGASQMNTSYSVASLRSSFFLPVNASKSARSKTLSAEELFAFITKSPPEATTQTLLGLPVTCGSSTTSWILPSGDFMSISTMSRIKSTVWLNFFPPDFAFACLIPSVIVLLSRGIFKPRAIERFETHY